MKMHSAREGILRNSLGEGLLSYGNPLGAGGIFVKTHSTRNDSLMEIQPNQCISACATPLCGGRNLRANSTVEAKSFAQTPRWRHGEGRHGPLGRHPCRRGKDSYENPLGEGRIPDEIHSARQGILSKTSQRGAIFLRKSTRRGKDSYGCPLSEARFPCENPPGKGRILTKIHSGRDGFLTKMHSVREGFLRKTTRGGTDS